MSWQANAIMYWSDDAGNTWHKVTDHSRQSLSISITRIETPNRMVDGTLRRYVVAKKRQFSTSWDMIPAKITNTNGIHVGLGTVDGGYAGEDIESWHNSHDGSFLVKLRKGLDEAKAITDGTIEVVTVMITDFSKEIIKRGPAMDYWSISLTLEEV